MFVGVGTSRVRSCLKMLKRLRELSPLLMKLMLLSCRRGTGMGGGNDEREQTLNQLLIEMMGLMAMRYYCHCCNQP